MLKKHLQNRKSGFRSVATVASAAVIAISLAGCSLLDGPTPERPDRPVVVAPDEEATYVEGGSAEDNLPVFLKTLSDASKQEGAFESRALAQRFIDVGFAVESMQVSQDRTKTDLETESMFVSARFGDQCIVGQIVTADRTIEAEIMPTVGPDNDLCLIGKTEPLTDE